MHGVADSTEQGDHEKRWVAMSSVVAAVFLTAMKLVVGYMSGSLGILSEAAHSGLDLLAALVTLWAVRVSSRPADKDHPYGHGKVENLSALFETLLLLGTCAWIVVEAIERLTGKPVEIEASVWGFVVMGISIIIDISRSRALAKTAKKYQSQALEADALHFSTDIWSSAVVILGLVCVLIARNFNIPWLVHADAVAALGVAVIVVWVSLQLGRRSVEALIDTVPADLRDRLAEAAQTVAGVRRVDQVRVRYAGADSFVDITLGVDPDLSLERAHQLSSQVEEAVQTVLKGADVVVHAEPTAVPDEGDNAFAIVHRVAARHGVQAHSVTVTTESVSAHIEVAPDLILAEAHEAATAFEHDVKKELPSIRRVVTHIEPRMPEMAAVIADEHTIVRMMAGISASCASIPNLGMPHNLEVRTLTGHLDISFHCVMPTDTSIAVAHDASEVLESLLRQQYPELRRVTIHVEPDKR
jgi:cation diffusion facilitator family transporter